MAVAGRVAIVPKGAYSETATYKKLDLVTYNEAAYIAKRESTGIEPTDGDDWMLLVSTDLTEIRNEISDIADGSTVVGKAESDGDGNKIPDTYQKQRYFHGGGVGGQTGYVVFAQVKIIGRYTNSPVEFKIIRRHATTPCTVSLRFANVDNQDPTVESLVFMGVDYNVFAHKADTSTWLLYYKKSELWDGITTHEVYYNKSMFEITYPNTFITEKPTENVVNATLGYSVEKAEKDIDGNVIPDTYLRQDKVANNLVTNDSSYALGAPQGVALNEKIEELKKVTLLNKTEIVTSSSMTLILSDSLRNYKTIYIMTTHNRATYFCTGIITVPVDFFTLDMTSTGNGVYQYFSQIAQSADPNDVTSLTYLYTKYLSDTSIEFCCGEGSGQVYVYGIK